MKKIVSGLLFGLFIFVFTCSVQATSYSVQTLIPVDTTATVDTELFTYQDFVYHSEVDAKGNATITFNQIVNHTDNKIPVSVNILLFNDKQENIGYLTYCTDKDLDSDYNHFKIDKQQSVPFTINVTSRYFGTHTESGELSDKEIPYTAKEVKYIAVMDENKYCTVGGYDNYVGKTLGEIISLASSKKDKDIVSKATSNPQLLQKVIFITICVIFAGIVIFGLKLLIEKVSAMILSGLKNMPKQRKNEPSSNNKNDQPLPNEFFNAPQEKEASVQPNKGDEVLDLNYHGEVQNDTSGIVTSGSDSGNMDDLFTISAGESMGDVKQDTSSDKKEEKKLVNSKDGESDLSKFFK